MQEKKKVRAIKLRKQRKASRDRLIALISNIQNRTEDTPLREIRKTVREAVKAARDKTRSTRACAHF